MNYTKLPRRFALTLSGAAALLLMSVFGMLWASSASAQEIDGDDFVDGEVVVKLDPASVATVDDINREYGTATKETLLSNAARIYLLRVTDGEGTLAKIERMRGDARLVYAEPNYTTDAPEDSRHMRQRADSVPSPSSDSALYRSQYAVEALNLPEAHGVNKGAGATVAVLDTGAQLDHPELAGSLVAGYDFIGDDPDPSEEPDSVDDDGDGNTDEAMGHGTHVVGVVHLTAPDAKIMPLRVLDSDGRGNVFVIAEAIQRAVDPDNDPATDDGVDVINMSLSSSRESNLIRDVSDDLDVDDDDDDDDETGPALRGVPTNGVTVVGSAGNDAAEQPAYPAAETGVIGVASVDRHETKSDFSNYFGSPEVDVSAPGDDIYSTFTEGRYAEWDGTSMAAPFVAGQAALIRSMRPGLPSTGPQGQPSVSEFITITARPLDAKNPDYSGKLGAGHADVYRSTLRANTAPTITQMSPAPGSRTRDRTPLLTATVGDAQADLAEDNVRL
ncbi:MAG: S8 family serine peptidase, partial [Actinomycetota bacterium]|nr:S8 family serine peptidase [Actinomycetota bacterium]